MKYTLARRGLWMAPLLLLLALAGCGTKGIPPTLGKTGTTSLSGAYTGSLTLTPIRSTHVVVYYLNKLVPYDAATPVELRQSGCYGKEIAALTKATATPPPANAAFVIPAGAGQKGVMVAEAIDANVFVVVLDHANDANAKVLTCGDPLNDKRQWFDLFTPDQGANGPQLGLSLIEPMVATNATTHLSAPAATALTWTVYNGACSGAPLAQGQIAAGATSGSGVIFQPAGSSWSAAIAPTGQSSGDCQKLNS